MRKILYVHDLDESKACLTALNLREIVKEKIPSAEFIAIDFPVDANTSFRALKKIIREEKIDLVVASGVGAYITLYAIGVEKLNTKAVLINPCLIPENNVPACFGIGKRKFKYPREDKEIEFELTSRLYEEYGVMSLNMYKNKMNFNNVIAFFSEYDEYYYFEDEYDYLINENHYFLPYGTHTLDKGELYYVVMPKLIELLNKD